MISLYARVLEEGGVQQSHLGRRKGVRGEKEVIAHSD